MSAGFLDIEEAAARERLEARRHEMALAAMAAAIREAMVALDPPLTPFASVFPADRPAADCAANGEDV